MAHEFPAVFAACAAAGIDPRHQPIPVLPATHYHMGGVATDLHGATSLTGLYAAGECAATGVHGANRLASNSLLEAAVFGARVGRAGRDAISGAGRIMPAFPAPNLPRGAMTELRARMTAQAGVVRDAAGLGALLAWIAAAETAHGPALPLVAAKLVAGRALDRRESRGAHFRADHPAADASAVHTRFTLTGAQGQTRRAA